MKSTYRCPGCERTFECRPDQLARLLERGQTACKFCGGELEFPEGLREALASAEPLAGVAWDPSEEVSYACEGCQKIFKVPLERAAFLCGRATPCQLCGGALSWPDAARAAWADLQRKGVVGWERQTPCLVCARAQTFDGRQRELPLTCPTCGARYLPPLEEGAAPRPEPASEPAAASDARALAGWLGEVLAARAERGLLAAGEAPRLDEALRGASRWEPSADALFLPLSLELAEPLLGSLLFPGQPFTLDRSAEGVELVFVVATSGGGELASNVGKTMAYNLLGLATMAMTGLGFFRRSSETEAGVRSQQRLRLGLRPASRRGVQLSLQDQRDARPPKPASGEATAELGARLGRLKPAVLAYLRALALFGEAARGAGAFSLTSAAVRTRLAALGVAGELPAPEDFCPSLVMASVDG